MMNNTCTKLILNNQVRVEYSKGRRTFPSKVTVANALVELVNGVSTGAEFQSQNYVKISNQNGSETIAYLSLIAELAAPFQDKADEGILSVSLNFSQLEQPDIESWTSMIEPVTIEYNRLLDRGLRSSMIDLKKLSISKDRCVKINVDVLILKDSGLIIDLLYSAILRYLKSYKTPNFYVTSEDMTKTIIHESVSILKEKCAATTVHTIGGYTFTDCSALEAESMDCSILVVSTEDGVLKAMQKRGVNSISEVDLLSSIELAIELNKKRILAANSL